MDTTRVDKWLWAVRLTKTRSAATDACSAGHVKVNGAPAKPAHPVKVGDRVEAYLHGRQRILEVVRIIEKRVSAPLAAECLVDDSPPPRRRRSGSPTSPATRAPAAQPRRNVAASTVSGTPGDGGAGALPGGDPPRLRTDAGAPPPRRLGRRVRRPGQQRPAPRGLPPRGVVRRVRGRLGRRLPPAPHPGLGRHPLHRRSRHQEAHRGRGHAHRLLDWILAEARRLGCAAVHLDSAPHRHAAHRLYLNEGYVISSFHFSRAL